MNLLENQAIFNSFLGSGPFISSPVGSIAQLDVVIQALPGSTTISHEVNQTGQSAFAAPTVLDVNEDLSLVILGDQLGENYVINSLTFTSGLSAVIAVVAPNAWGGFELGLLSLGLGVYRQRFVLSDQYRK